MSVIHPGVFLVLKRYQGSEDILRRLYLEDKTFKSICEDYQKCAEALEHWNQSTLEKAPMRVNEYSALLAELEEEIRCYLGDSY